jgi:hypothetical protein
MSRIIAQSPTLMDKADTRRETTTDASDLRRHLTSTDVLLGKYRVVERTMPGVDLH